MSSLENLIKYFFARDLLNYARLMPVHLAQINALEEDDPETLNALESCLCRGEIGDTLPSSLHQSGSRAGDKVAKGCGSMVGLSRDEADLD